MTNYHDFESLYVIPTNIMTNSIFTLSTLLLWREYEKQMAQTIVF
jgi:hypothetical protein